MAHSGKRSTTLLLNYQQLMIALGLLVVLALVVFIWMIPAQQSGKGQQQAIDNSIPDYFGDQVVSQKYDTQGLIVNKLQAATIKHYPLTDITWLTQPRLWEYNGANKVTWHAVSDKGEMLSDHKTFKLLGNVIVTQPATANQVEVRLKTNKMTVYTSGHDTD